MLNKTENSRTRRLLRAALGWLLSAAALLPALAWLITRLRLDRPALILLSAAVPALATAVSALLYCKGGGQRMRLSWLLFSLVVGAVLLTTGFLAYGEGMTAGGLVRILVSVVIGAGVGFFLSGAGSGKRRGAKRKGIRLT